MIANNNSSLIPENIHLKIGNLNIKILLLLFVRGNKRKHTSEKSHSIAIRQASSRIALETFQRFRRRARFPEKILPKSLAEEKDVLDVRVPPQLSTFRFYGSRIPFSTRLVHLVFPVRRRFASRSIDATREATSAYVPPSVDILVVDAFIWAEYRDDAYVPRSRPVDSFFWPTLEHASFPWFPFYLFLRVVPFSNSMLFAKRESKGVERREGCKGPWSIIYNKR